MKSTKFSFMSVTLVLFLSFFISCGGGGGGDSSSSGGTGTLSLSMTDSSSEFEAVYVTIVLEGITRKYVLQVARQIMPVEERQLRLEELWDCDEAFITGTSKHVMPVVEVEGRMIGNGKPGEKTKLVAEVYERFFGLW